MERHDLQATELVEEKSTRWLVGDLILDAGKRQISRAGQPLVLPKLSYRLFVALAEAAPNVLSHDQLVERVWPGRVVSPETVTQRIKLVRESLGDDASAPRYIGLVRGEGYRLLADVDVLPPEDANITRSLMAELGRRRVLQAALLYAAVAWSITEVVSFLLDALPVFPSWSKSLVAIIFVVGFPVAMFLAWRFDLGPGGVKRTEAGSNKGKWTIATAMLLLLGATAALFYLIYPSVVQQQLNESPLASTAQSLPEPNTVAVLPFVNGSSNPDDVYLSEGVSDDLRDQLGRLSHLRVAARSSSVIFRDETSDAVSISERLRVGKLIEGTMRRQGEQIRITVQIIDGATGFQDWTRSFTRSSDDLLAVQREIAVDVVNHMLPELDESYTEYVAPTVDATANELMLVARHHFHEVQEAPVVDLALLRRAIDLYRQATVIDPSSALAQSRLSEALLYLGDVDAAEGPIFRALKLDPELSEVQNTLGLYYWIRFLPGSGDAHLRAIELNPNNADALEKYGKWLWHQQITNEVEPYFIRALELDTMSLSRYLDLGHFYGISNRREEALEVTRRIQSRFRGADAYMAMARIHELTGDLDVAIAWALKARELQPKDAEKSWLVAELYARIGDFDAARHFEGSTAAFNILYWERRYDEMIDLGEELVLEQPNQVQLWYGLARAYAATGRFDQAIYVLQQQGLPEHALVDSRRANGSEALVTLADALQQTGKVERAQDQAAWLAESFASLSDTGGGDSWWPNLYQSCSLSILDKDQEALAVLERVNNSIGLLWYPILLDAPCFRKFKSEPRYLQVVANYESRLAELRQKLPDTLARMQGIE